MANILYSLFFIFYLVGLDQKNKINLVMQAISGYNAFMKTNATRQYTIRNIPANIDRAMRKRMKDEGKSLNEAAIEALARGSDESIRPRRDLSYLIGSMSEKEADAINTEIDAQRTIDPDLWR
jgi:hypothetical protein